MTYRYGGWDVVYASIMSQERKPDLWIVADDLCDQRREIVREKTSDAPFEVIHFAPRQKPDGYFSDLANIYNEMLFVAEEENCDLAVSVQDYLWFSPVGISRFVEAYEELRRRGVHPLITGLASHAGDPGPEHVMNSTGMWSVYAEDYDGHRPETTTWEDVRPSMMTHSGLQRISPICWELNWAAIDVELFSMGNRFPEHYGKGISHENIAFAVECMLNSDAQVWIDPMNYSMGLPHRAYWPEQEASGGSKSVENMEMFHAEYGAVVHDL